MNKSTKSLYVVVSDNKVIAFGNLKETIITLNRIVSNSRNYQHYYRQFKQEPLFAQQINGKSYYFQKLV